MGACIVSLWTRLTSWNTSFTLTDGSRDCSITHEAYVLGMAAVAHIGGAVATGEQSQTVLAHTHHLVQQNWSPGWGRGEPEHRGRETPKRQWNAEEITTANFNSVQISVVYPHEAWQVVKGNNLQVRGDYFTPVHLPRPTETIAYRRTELFSVRFLVTGGWEGHSYSRSKL